MTAPVRVLLLRSPEHADTSEADLETKYGRRLKLKVTSSSVECKRALATDDFELLAVLSPPTAGLGLEAATILADLEDSRPDLVILDPEGCTEDESAETTSLPELLTLLARDLVPRQAGSAQSKPPGPFGSEGGSSRLLEAVSDGIALHELVYDRQGRPSGYVIRQANPAYSRHSGIPLEKVLGTEATDRHGCSRAPFLELLSRLTGDRETVRFDTYLPSLARRLQICAYSPRPGWVVTVIADVTEQRTLQQSLLTAIEWQQALSEGSRDAIFITDQEHQLVAVNRAASDLTGYTRDELVGMRIPDFHTPEDFAALEPILHGIFQGEKTLVQLPMLRRDGTKVFTEFSNRKIEVSGRVYVHTVARDVEDRVRAKQLLELSEQRFRLLAENASDAIMLHTVEGYCLYASPACLQVFGYDPEALAGVHAYGFVHPEDQAGFSEAHRQVVTTGRPAVHTFRCRRPDGTFGWVETTAKLVPKAESGGRAAILTVSRDITARKHSAAALQESESKFRALFERSGIGIAIVTPEGRIEECNARLEEILGYADEELRNRHFSEVTHPTDVQEDVRLFEQLAKGESQFYTLEKRFVRSNGSIVWGRLTASRIVQADGNWKGVGMVEDISESKRLLQLLRKSRSRYRALTENSDDVIMRFDRQCRHLYVNPAVERLTGIPASEFRRKTHREMGFPDSSCQEWETRIRSVFDTGKSLETIFTYDTGDRTIVFDWRLTPEFNSDGTIRTVLSSARDVTAQKRAEQSLRESEERLNLALEAANEAYWELDLSTGAASVSRHFCGMLGYGPEELPATLDQFLPLVHPDDRDRFITRTSDRQGGLVSSQSFEFRMKEKSGNYRWMMSRGKGLDLNEDSSPRRLIGTVLDINDRKEAEKTKRNLELQLQQSQKLEALGVLAGGIAHDFNNILAAIFGFTELALFQVPDGSPVREDLEEVLAGARRARDLVRQILSFSRKENQERKRLELRILVKEASRLMRATLPSTISIEHDIRGSFTVLADPTQIHQILMNLCANAAHAMREKGGVLSIRLSEKLISEASDSPLGQLTPPGRYAELVVADTGHGMSSGVLERIFEPFFTTKPKEEGTGLGLSVAYGIVRALGGAIQASSTPGQGSAFRVYLPLVEERAEDEPLKPDGTVPRGTERILWVDDETSVLSAAGRAFKALGYNIITESNAREALARFQREPHAFDLLITDQTMPGLTGLELAKECLKASPDLAVILCTGYSDQVTPEKARAEGIRRFVMKPLAFQQMADIVRQVLDRSE